MFRKFLGRQQETTIFEADGKATLYVTLKIENEKLDNYIASSIGDVPGGWITLFIDFNEGRFEASAEYFYDDIEHCGREVVEKTALMKLIDELRQDEKLSQDPLVDLWTRLMHSQLN